MEIPYKHHEFQKFFSRIPTGNLYWEPYDNGRYLVDNGEDLMFYLDGDDIYYPTNPIYATETYYVISSCGKTGNTI